MQIEVHMEISGLKSPAPPNPPVTGILQGHLPVGPGEPLLLLPAQVVRDEGPG